MTVVRVSKTFHFEAAHALDGYLGKCQDIHGHSYHLKIVVTGKTIDDPADPCCGMVLDFGELKSVVKEHVLPLFDHRLILRFDSRFKGIESNNERVRYVAYQPTCENMLLEIVDTLKDRLPNGITLQELRLQETPSSSAEWHRSDQYKNT